MSRRASLRLPLQIAFALSVAAAPLLHASPLALLSDAAPQKNVSALRVHVVDYAGVIADEIARAEAETARLWRAIDVNLSWQPGEAESLAQHPHDEPSASSSASIPPDALDVTVVILRQDMAQRMIVSEHRGDGVLGRAVPEALRAYIFYDRVTGAAGALAAARSAVLGRVVAHELGHLLLGHTHSYNGLMRAEPELGSSRIAFDPGDGVRIRAGIVRRRVGD